ncbi:MAG: hypothetical protein V7765_06150 [Oleispira sp.]
MSLDSIDTSYWLTKDEIWFDERKAQWPAIEKVVSDNRKRTEVNVIKQYFLRGKMPKWERYQDWDDLYRHLDLMHLLWLHPSTDYEVLKPLYIEYMESDLIHRKDILLGYTLFLKHEFRTAPSSKKSLKDYPFPFMGDKNILLFNIMFEDVSYVKDKINRFPDSQQNISKKIKYILEFMGFEHFLRIRRWLMQDKASPLSLHCIYQFDKALEWGLTTLTEEQSGEFLKGLEIPEFVKSYQKSLYCLYHFDTDKEGDTCRTQFVHKIRKILDERDFIPEFKQMWQDVKEGKIEVKDPWKR